MPYPNEHAARVKNPGSCDSFKRMNQGSGVSLILCIKDGKSSAQSYRFKKDQFTPEQAKEWLKKHDINPISFEEASGKDVNAKLSMKAAMGKPEVDGMIWSAGTHYVYVNGKPARVHVPEETVMDTFKSIKSLIEDQGRMPIGIDHLSDSTLEENDILKKMNLLDVGSVTKVGTDGTSIYILDSELTNDQIKALNAQGEIPAYSIVGAMDARPCPSGKADYVVDSIDVERVDFVEEGGCQVCKVGAQPSELILTSKKVKEEETSMVEEVNEAPKEEAVEEVSEVPADEAPVAEEAEEKVEPEAPEKEEASEEVVVVEEEDKVAKLEEEIAELKKLIKDDLGGKRPKESSDAEKQVNDLIKAGKALPKMKASLVKLADQDPEAFKELAASMPKMVKMEAQAKLAKIAKQTEEKPKPENKKPEDLTAEEAVELEVIKKAFRL